MTPDALHALQQAGFTRRAFLKGSGALIVSFSAAGVVGKLGLAPGRVFAQVPQVDGGQVSIRGSPLPPMGA